MTVIHGADKLKAVIVSGTQRSGTTVFRQLIASHESYIDANEIFHPLKVHTAEDNFFYAFLRKKVAEDESYICLHRQREAINLFLKQINLIAPLIPIIDVKYSDYLQLISGTLGNIKPWIVDFVYNYNLPFFHIIRKNKLELLISLKIAQITNVWNSKQGDYRYTNKLILDANETKHFILSLIRDDEAICNYFKHYQYYNLMTYETMFNNGNFSQSTIEKVANALEKDIKDFNPIPGSLKQNTKPLNELIENYDEIHEALQEINCEWMLQKKSVTVHYQK